MFVLTLSAHITIEKGKIIELIKSKRMPIIEISSLSHPGVVIFLSIQASVIYLLCSPDIHLPAECFVPCGVLN